MSNAHPALERMTAVHGVAGPGITDVRVSSPGPDGLWTAGKRLEVRYTFGAPMTVTTSSGMPVTWIQRVYESGKIYGETVPFNRIDTSDANTLVFAKTLGGNERTKALKIPADSIYPKHGVIAGTDTGAIAVFTHREYQSKDSEFCGTFPDEIWCAKMTVGVEAGDGSITGFHQGIYGTLSRGQFNYDGSPYSIQHLRHVSDNSELYLGIRPVAGGAAVNNAGFHLHVGTISYSFPADNTGTNTNYLQWNNADPGWMPGDEVVVRLTGRASDDEVEVGAPTVRLAPSVSPAGSDNRWTEGETVEVTLSFSEAVEVDTSGGRPSLGIALGSAHARTAAYLRGSGTTELVFAYTLVGGDGGHTSMAVTANSLALNGGTIRSVATSENATLAHGQTIVRGGGGRSTEGPTARFEGVPANHDGTNEFTVELHFSAAPTELSQTTVAGGLLEATGATVVGARQLTAGSDLAWEVTVRPDGGGDIALRLPVRPCGKPNAICVGERPLAQAASATVYGTPFTASFSGAPAEHSGSGSFEIQLRLSEEPAGLSYRTVQNGLFDVTGANIRVSPDTSGRGLTLSIAPQWGQTASAAGRLWGAHDASGLGSDSEFKAGKSLRLDAGYGVGLAGNRGVFTPYAGMTLGDNAERTVRTGARWQLNPDVVVGLEGSRQASGAGEADNQVKLRAALRF